MIAIDLGAESCRVSLLRWLDGVPHIELVHRHAHAPVNHNGELRWDLGQITQQMDVGLRKCAEIASEGIRSIAADGWAVDYVRLNQNGEPSPILSAIAMSEPSARRQKSANEFRQLIFAPLPASR